MFDNYGNQPAPVAPPPSNTRIVRFDKAYLGTPSGILKLVQFASNLIGFICIKFSTQFISAVFYNILYWFANIVTILLLIMYLFHFVEKFDQVPWAKLEFYYCVLITLVYIGCSISAIITAESIGYAVGFFGFCAVVAYGMDGYLKYKAWKRGLPPQ